MLEVFTLSMIETGGDFFQKVDNRQMLRANAFALSAGDAVGRFSVFPRQGVIIAE